MFGESQTEANKAKLTAELRAWRAENTPDAQIDFSTGSDDLEVDDLYVDPSARDKGQATALMNKLCELADRYGVVLSLRPVTKEEGQGPDDLGVWYSRWGFAWETRDGDLMMFRDPANRVLAETADVEQPFPGLTPELVARLQEIRHQCRVDNQGGGACHLVSEWIEDEFGWRRTSGTYTSRDYQDVAIAGHLWNILPDGSILDATADQTGEGHDIRVIAPDDPEYHRYRPEWYDDYHPGHEEYENEDFSKYREVYHPGFDASRYPAFNGEQDYDAGARLSKERGQHWWATDREQLERYLKDQRDKYGYDIRRGFQP
jgi:predicted GNAT family acetyltransferase